MTEQWQAADEHGRRWSMDEWELRRMLATRNEALAVDRELERVIAQGRADLLRAKLERFARIGLWLWTSSLALLVVAWMAAAVFLSARLSWVGLVLVIPTMVGLAIHGINSPDEPDAKARS